MQHALIIVGAGGLGREVYHWALDAGFSVKGFLDDNLNALQNYTGYPPVLGTPDAWHPQPDEDFVCAIGTLAYRKKVIKTLSAQNATFVSLIHPTAICYSQPGPAALVGPYVVIGPDATIGPYLFVQNHSTIGHDALIGAFCRCDVATFIGGYATLHDDVTLHTGAKIHPEKVVAQGVTVGINTTILTRTKPNTTYFGTPAMPL